MIKKWLKKLLQPIVAELVEKQIEMGIKTALGALNNLQIEVSKDKKESLKDIADYINNSSYLQLIHDMEVLLSIDKKHALLHLYDIRMRELHDQTLEYLEQLTLV